jgi:hypothetical protein
MKKRTLTVYKNVTQYNNKQKHSHDSVTNKNINTVIAVLFSWLLYGVAF